MAPKKPRVSRSKIPPATVVPRGLPAGPTEATARIKAMFAAKMHNASWEFRVEDYRALAELVKPLSEHDRAVVMAEVIKHLKEKDRLSHFIEDYFMEHGLI